MRWVGAQYNYNDYDPLYDNKEYERRQDTRYSSSSSPMYGTDWEKNQRHGKGILAIDSPGGFSLPR